MTYHKLNRDPPGWPIIHVPYTMKTVLPTVITDDKYIDYISFVLLFCFLCFPTDDENIGTNECSYRCKYISNMYHFAFHVSIYQSLNIIESGKVFCNYKYIYTTCKHM